MVTEWLQWLPLHAMRATTGAAAMAYAASFYGPFTTEKLPLLIAALISGGLLGLLLWSDVWDTVRLLSPAALQPFADTLARDGLAAGELLGSKFVGCALAPPPSLAALCMCHCGSDRSLLLLPPSALSQATMRFWVRCPTTTLS